MIVLEIVVVFSVISLIIIRVGLEFILIYRRYFKSFYKEIDDFLNTKDLKLKKSFYPNKSDWKNSPFTKPSIKEFVFLKANIFTFFDRNQRKHKVIQTIEGPKYWLEIETTYFNKPKLIFRKAKEIEITIINEVFDKCPACDFSLLKIDKICPGCELHFK